MKDHKEIGTTVCCICGFPQIDPSIGGVKFYRNDKTGEMACETCLKKMEGKK